MDVLKESLNYIKSIKRTVETQQSSPMHDGICRHGGKRQGNKYLVFFILFFMSIKR